MSTFKARVIVVFMKNFLVGVADPAASIGSGPRFQTIHILLSLPMAIQTNSK